MKDDFILTAVMDAEERTVLHVHQLLRSRGIRFTAEGGVISELCVAREDFERAIPLLQAQRAEGWIISVTPFVYDDDLA
jgi:hypothetical protein